MASVGGVLGPRKTIEETLESTETETHRLRRGPRRAGHPRAGGRRHHRRWDLRPRGRGRGHEGPPGDLALLRPRGGRLRARGAVLRGVRRARAGRRQRLHVLLRHAGPAHRVHHRLGPRPRVHARRVGGGGRLRRLPELAAGPALRRDDSRLGGRPAGGRRDRQRLRDRDRAARRVHPRPGHPHHRPHDDAARRAHARRPAARRRGGLDRGRHGELATAGDPSGSSARWRSSPSCTSPSRSC